MPLIEHIGQLEITASLFSSTEGTTILLDRTTTIVHELKLPVAKGLLRGVLALCVSLLAVVLTILFFKKQAIRRDLLISVLLFSSAILLRAPNVLKVVLHPDELTIAYRSCELMFNDWTWTKDMMKIIYPPLYWYLEAIMIYLVGIRFEIFRLLPIVASSLTVVVVYMFGKSMFNRLTGFLSAILFSFSSFTILISRISLMDSFVLLATLSSAYFFWKGFQSKEIKYMALSGVLLGLAFDTKYIAAFTFLGCLIFVVWVKKDLKSIFRKHMLVWLISFILVILPVQISFLVNDVNPYIKLLERWFPPGNGLPLIHLMDAPAKGLKVLIFWFTRSANPWLPWVDLFKFVSAILLPLAVIYHVYPALKARPRESFLIISCLATLPPLISPLVHTYWMIYMLPYLFIMISNLTVQAWHGFSDSKLTKTSLRPMKYVGTLRISALFLVTIFLSSQLITGIASPAIDEGDFDSFGRAIVFIKNRVEPGDVIATREGGRVGYFINQYNLNITEIPFSSMQMRRGVTHARYTTPEEVYGFNPSILELDSLKFILIHRLQLDVNLNNTERRMLFEKYMIVFVSTPRLGYSKWYPEQTWLVLERFPNIELDGEK